MQRNGNYPLISSYEGKLVNVFCSENSLDFKVTSVPLIQDSIIDDDKDYIIESDNELQHIYETDLAYLHEILDKVLSYHLKFIYLYCIYF